MASFHTPRGGDDAPYDYGHPGTAGSRSRDLRGTDDPDYGYSDPASPYPQDYEAQVFATDEPRPMQRWINFAGAATSVLLVLGVIVWGYKLAMRDIQGVPVIQALQGPGRVAPEDPGGELARHVGLSVNDVAGTGVAAPAPDQVALAPPEAELSDQDTPMTDLRPIEADDLPVEAEPETPEPLIPPQPDADAHIDTGETPTQQSVDDLAALAGADAPDTDATDSDALSIDASDIIPADVPGVTRSPRPASKPGRDLMAEATASAVAIAMGGGSPAAADGPVEIDAQNLPSGTRLVQLGAFDSADLARAGWDQAVVRFGALMEGKKRVIQEARAGGRTFYRLRVQGFENITEARRFCAALVAENATCIPALVH